MWNRTDSPMLRYGCAIVSVALAIGVRLILDPVLGDKFVFTLLSFSVMVASWFGGFGPAVAATLLGAAAAALLFLTPRGSFDIHGIVNQTGTVLYLAGGFGIAVLGGSMRKAQRQAEGNAQRVLVKQKEIEVALQERQLGEERLRVTLQSIGDAVIGTDVEGRITFLNQVAMQLTAWRQDEAQGKPLVDVFKIINEQSRQPVENPTLRALREGVIVGLANHTILVARDGTERLIDDSAAPIRAGNGTILGVVLVFRDVTQERFAERELRRSEVRNHLLSDVSAALVGSLHYQSILRQVADLLVPMLGDVCFLDVLSDDDVLERVAWRHVDQAKEQRSNKAQRFVPPKDSQFHPVAKVRRTGQPELISTVSDDWLQDTANSPEHLDFLRELNIHSVLCVPMLIGQRQLGVLTCAYCDSGRRHTPEDLELATEVAGRLALTIENSKLFNQLRQADQKKSEFIAVLAHELRNPLAPITNALELMRIPGEKEEIGPLRDMMERQVQQMVHLIDDLLDVSRITSGKIVLRKERLDLSDVVNSALETSRSLIEIAKHELTVTMPSEALYVEGDKTRLAQVLSNLLSNSAKYTPEGGHIWLSVCRDGQNAMIRLRDTGIGIPAEMLPRIFEMFTQLDRTLGRSQGGLGIGLALVRCLVEMHGGTVEAHSDGPGQGSEFVVRLPLASDEGSQQESNDKETAIPITGDAPARLRILVVDDNKDAAVSLDRLLKVMGNEVRVAGDGPSALETAATFRPQVVLLDIGLPGMSGLDVARTMRQMPEVKDAVLIAQTGWGQDEDKRQTKEAGFNAHLVKPLDTAELQSLLAGLPDKMD